MASSQLEQKQKTPLMVFFVAIFLFESIHIYAQKQKKVLLHRTFSTAGEPATGRLLPYYLLS